MIGKEIETMISGDFGKFSNLAQSALHFNSEKDFDAAIDHLVPTYPVEVAGFDVLLIPTASSSAIEHILREAGIAFESVNVRTAVDLSSEDQMKLHSASSRKLKAS
jgi:hypothetical protein